MLLAQPQFDLSHGLQPRRGARPLRHIAFVLALPLIVLAGCAEQSQAVNGDPMPVLRESGFRVSHLEPVSVAGPGGHVTVSASLPDQALESEQALNVLLRFTIEPGFHIYRASDSLGPFTPISVRVVLDESEVTIDQPTIPETDEMVDGKPVIRDTLAVHAGVTFSNPKPGTFTLKVHVQYQACNDLVCMSPEDFVVALPIVIQSSSPPSKG